MNKITLAGNIIVDNVKTITAWPDKGMLVPITDVKRSPGGAVPNSGIDLKTLDPSVEVAAVGKVGDDDAGAFVTGFLAEKGLDVSRVARVPGVPTTFTDVMTVAGTGRPLGDQHTVDKRLVEGGGADGKGSGALALHARGEGQMVVLLALRAGTPDGERLLKAIKFHIIFPIRVFLFER